MDEAIIANWNRVVDDEDLVLCLGDFCFGTKDNIPYYTRRLRGRKILIKGNHDRSRSLYLDAGFQEVMSEFVLHPEQAGNKKTILFCHKPRMGIRCDVANIHGHIHEQTLDPTIFEIGNYFNVSVENIDYTPIDLQEIIKRMDW
jgi:calcineurin-like phosphoesterase family protein